MGDVLAVLTLFFPFDDEARRCIASLASLKSPVSVMSHGELLARTSTVVVHLEIVSSADRHTPEAVLGTLGMCNALVGLVRQGSPISRQAKAMFVMAY